MSEGEQQTQDFQSRSPATKVTMDPWIKGVIATAVVGTAILIAVIAFLVLTQLNPPINASATTSGATAPVTNTDVMIATNVSGTEKAPAAITGPYNTYISNLSFSPGFNSILWLTGNQELSLSPTWLYGANYNSSSNVVTQYTLPAQLSSTTMNIGLTGIAFDNSTSKPTDTDVPYGFSLVFAQGSSGGATSDLTLPITLPGAATDYILFAQNGDPAANPTNFTCGTVLSTTSVRFGYYGGVTSGLCRVNFIVVKKKTVSTSAVPLAYCDSKILTTTPTGFQTVNVTLATPVPTGGTLDPVWYGFTQSSSFVNAPTYGVEQIDNNTISVGINTTASAVTVAYFCFNGAITTTFAY